MSVNAKKSKCDRTKKNSYRKSSKDQSSKSFNTRDDEKVLNKRGSGRDNDPSWYTRYPGIYSATANLSFNNPAGIGINLKEANDQAVNVETAPIYIPTAMGLRFTMCPGVTTSGSSLINTAMFQNYNFVRHANSGSKNYDAVDLQMYFLAVDTAYTMYMMGCRAYGLLARFSALNRSVPRSLFAAMGLDYDSWASDPAQVRARLNLVAAKLSSLKVPAGNTMLARHLFLVSQVFMDGDSEKCQAYVFSPAGYHSWGRADQVGTLTYHDIVSTDIAGQMTADAYFELMDGLCKPLLEDEDINIMSGDVLKAYGYEKCLNIAMIDETFVAPLVSLSSVPYLASQIENAIPANLDVATFNITQSVDGHIMFDPNRAFDIGDARSMMASVGNLLNSRSVEVSNEEILEMTRLHPTFSSKFNETGDKVVVRIRSCGTEFIQNIIIVSRNDTKITLNYANTFLENLNQTTIPSIIYFDWAPLLYIGTTVKLGSTVNGRISNIIGDLANFTVVSKNTIDYIHDTCVASELLIDNVN